MVLKKARDFILLYLLPTNICVVCAWLLRLDGGAECAQSPRVLWTKIVMPAA
jgi:hypothetical protein